MNLNDAIEGILDSRKGTTPKPLWSHAGDSIFYFLQDTESFADRVDGVLTIYRAFDEPTRIVGFQIKGISTLVKGDFIDLGIAVADGRVKMAILLMVCGYLNRDPQLPEDQRWQIYQYLLEQAGPTEVDLKRAGLEPAGA